MTSEEGKAGERIAKIYVLERQRRKGAPPNWFGDPKENATDYRIRNLTLERDELRLLVEMAADALEGLGDETTAPILRACLENLKKEA